MQSRELVKLYYRIGEVSEIVGVQPHVLRYWETEFRSIRPQKSSKGQRVYSRRDVEKLLRVKDLLRNQGFTIAGARKRLSDASEAAPTSSGHSAAPAAAQFIGGPSPALVPVSSVVASSVVASSVVASSASTSVAPVAVIARELGGETLERGLPEQGSSEHAHSDHGAKDMRKALLGLRQDLMRMLDHLSAQARDSH
jgi:DNA-binding transcriptional MerR regulator